MEGISLQRTAIKATMRIIAMGSMLRQQPQRVIPKSRQWTREEIMLLQNKYRHMTASELAAHLSRSIPSVRAKIKTLGLSKSRLTGKPTKRSSAKIARPSRKRTTEPSWKSKRTLKRTSKRKSSREKVVRKASTHSVRPILNRRG